MMYHVRLFVNLSMDVYPKLENGAVMKIKTCLCAMICFFYSFLSYAKVSRYIQFHNSTNNIIIITHCRQLLDDVNFSYQLEWEILRPEGISEAMHLYNNSFFFEKGVGVTCSLTGLDAEKQTLESSVRVLFDSNGEIQTKISYWKMHDEQWPIDYSKQGYERYVVYIKSKNG